jgi:hypothetical protein
MAGGRVAASVQARTAIKGVETDFTNGITDLRSRFQSRNSVLTNPQEFDGPYADRYKAEVVPQVQQYLAKWDNDVKELTTKIDQILHGIMQAGGGG